MNLPPADPRKLMRLSEPERALIAQAVGQYADEYATVDEQELAAQIIARMT